MHDLRRTLRTTLPLVLLTLAVPLEGQTPIEAGDVLDGSLAVGDTARFTFENEEEYFAYGEIDQISVDVRIRLVDDEGRAIATSDRTDRGVEFFGGPVATTGSWTLEVTAAEEDGAGEFELRVLMLEPFSDDPERLAEQTMFPFDRPGEPGGAIRVWRDGETVFSKGYGYADLSHDIPFDVDAPTNIGSTSKQFTAFAVLLEQDRGNLSLDDDIREYFPEFPEFTEQVTIRNLLTHTSGLREFYNLYVMAGVDARAFDREDVLRAVERQPALQNEPGAEFNYNNTAFSLAAQIVEKTSGLPFDEYMRVNVFEPLGMEHSVVRMENTDVIEGRTEGYARTEGGWTETGDLGSSVGAGGIYASVADLEKWGMNLLDPVVGTPEMVEAMMTEFTLNDGEGAGYGYGLFIDEQRGLKRVHHGGADISHRSMFILYPEIGAGLTTQGNAANFNSQQTAMELGAAFFDDDMEPEDVPVADEDFDPASYDAADFERVSGTYTLDPAPQVRARFWRDGDQYFTQLTNQPPVEMRPVAPDAFELVSVQARIVFDEGDPAPGFTLFQGGQEVPATRVADDEGEGDGPWAPTAEELADFEGRYYSDEIETFYTLSVEIEEGDEGEEEPRLVMHQLRMGDVPLQPGEPGTFTSASNISLEFERDRNGQVVGFYASNARTRDVRFVRIP
ncbi:MAG TPA: serine hydrolase domain-containing protein [Longimicrobiales bacterium]|nr:serine hydrolase domain-containing protein [Longimicrobiales bacterium]